MEKVKFDLYDLVIMRKPHPCGTNKWKIIRLGADIRIKCLGCNHSVMLSRSEFEKRIKKVEKPDQLELQKDVIKEKPKIKAINTIETVRYKQESKLEFKGETELYKMGYKITGLNRHQRWNILKNFAIPKLGVDKVTYTISSHIKNRKQQADGENKFKHAISEWEYDLKRIKEEYE